MNALTRRGSCLLFLLAISVSGIVFSAGCSAPEATAPPISGPVGGYHNGYFRGMRYGLFVPPSYVSSRKYPLIIYLHGSTDTTTWDLGWYHDPIQKDDPVFVLTPKSILPGLGWGSNWDTSLSVDMQNTMDLLADIVYRFSIDTTRLYVNGTSMGGFGTFNIISKRPGLFAGAYAICGGGTSMTGALMAQTPLWIFHGSADPVVPVQLSRDIYHAIQLAGGTQVRYTEYPGVGHNAWDYTAHEKTLERWLLAQRKGVTHGSPGTVRDVHVAVSDARATLTWNAPADTTVTDRAVWFYRVYRDGALITEVEEPTYADGSLTTGTYAYTVASVNYFFKESARSGPVQAVIP